MLGLCNVNSGTITIVHHLHTPALMIWTCVANSILVAFTRVSSPDVRVRWQKQWGGRLRHGVVVWGIVHSTKMHSLLIPPSILNSSVPSYIPLHLGILSHSYGLVFFIIPVTLFRSILLFSSHRGNQVWQPWSDHICSRFYVDNVRLSRNQTI